jgi:hypothetical protein
MKVKEYATGELKRLPDWVKCTKCGGKPTKDDWLLEIIPHSSALIHQSCAAGQGKFAGLNIGMEKGEKK